MLTSQGQAGAQAACRGQPTAINLNAITISPKQLYTNLWLAGEIDYAFRPHKQQRELYQFFNSLPPKSIAYIECVRGFGKTSGILQYLASKQMSRKLDVLYCTGTREQAQDIIDTHYEPLIGHCPGEIRPKKKQYRYLYNYHNEGVLKFTGLEREMKRGFGFDIIYVDEAAEIPDVYNLVFSVLYSMVERRNGLLILSSTPSTIPGHPSKQVRMHAQASGHYFRRDVYECELYTPSRIEEIKAKLGEDSVAWRREFLLEDDADKDMLVVPEFREAQHVYADPIPRPAYYDWYILMDLGFAPDFTHVLFCYWHWDLQKLIVEDEICVRNKLTRQIGDAIREKVGHLGHSTPPAGLFSDNDPQILADLYDSHGYYFQPKQEYDRDASTNRLRDFFRRNKILINFYCKNLIAQLKNGVKTKNHKDYERSDDLGHLDGIDALRHGLPMIRFDRSPYPENYGVNLQGKITVPEQFGQALSYNGIAPREAEL